METRFLLRACQRLRSSSPRAPRHLRLEHTHNRPSTSQANSLGEYYTSLLEFSSPTITSKPPTTASTSSQPPVSTSYNPRTENDPKPSILFSSRLSSPLERRAEIQKKSKLVAGILVPPRPDEPDNCCMSGCVNCVWDRYGEDLEEWAAATKKADAALRKEASTEDVRKGKRKSAPDIEGSGLMLGNGEKGAQHTMTSMDDDGGGSEALWGTGLDSDFTSDDLFKGVPVGIREFMKQEKRLKEKHAREGTSGG